MSRIKFTPCGPIVKVRPPLHRDAPVVGDGGVGRSGDVVEMVMVGAADRPGRGLLPLLMEEGDATRPPPVYPLF